jgi:uncharacterized protein
MKIVKLDSIPFEGLLIHFGVDPARLEEISRERPLGFVPSGPLEVEGELKKSGQDILFKGKIRGDIGLVCGRCLDPFLKALELPVRSEWRLLAAPDKSSGRARREGKEGIGQIEDLETGLTLEGVLDLEERILEEVILAIPILPLCREKCHGLCPVCGENRNLNPCTCKSRISTNPFSVLMDLKVEDQQK